MTRPLRQDVEPALAPAAALDGKTTTIIRPAGTLRHAEDYDQEYGPRHTGPLVEALIEHFGSDRAFVDSTAAARLNGLAGGHGDPERVKAELDLAADLLALVR